MLEVVRGSNDQDGLMFWHRTCVRSAFHESLQPYAFLRTAFAIEEGRFQEFLVPSQGDASSFLGKAP